MSTTARRQALLIPETHGDQNSDVYCDDGGPSGLGWSDTDGDDDDEETDGGRLSGLPPGEEGLYESGAGGESALIAETEELVTGRYVNGLNDVVFTNLISLTRRKDARKRLDRVQRIVDGWTKQMPELLEAFIIFTAKGPAEYIPQADDIKMETYGLNGEFYSNRFYIAVH